MTGQQADRTFSAALESFVEGRAELAPELWSFIHWLEDRGQTFHFRNSDRMFLPTVPIASVDRMWSNLYFSIDSGLVAAWFGQDCHDDGSLVPLVRCGGDGSYLALWRDSGAADRYVFLGSEGEAFTVADDVRSFIALITLGYYSIESREDLERTPADNWAQSEPADAWPGAADVQAWAVQQLAITYPATGAELRTQKTGPDPFTAWVASTTS